MLKSTMSLVRGQTDCGESIDENMEFDFISLSPTNADQNISLSNSSDQPSPCLSLHDLPPLSQTGQNHGDIILSIDEISYDAVLGSTKNIISEDNTSDHGPKLRADDDNDVAKPKLSGASSNNVDHSVGVIGTAGQQDDVSLVESSCDAVLGSPENVIPADDASAQGPKLSADDNNDVAEPKLPMNVDHSVGVIGTPGQQNDISSGSNLKTPEPSDKRTEVQGSSRQEGSSRAPRQAGNNLSNNISVGSNASSSHTIPISPGSICNVILEHHPTMTTGVGIYFSSHYHPHPSTGVHFARGMDLRSQQNPMLLNSLGTGSSTQNMVFVPSAPGNLLLPPINFNFGAGMSMDRRHLAELQGVSHYPQHHSLAVGSYGALTGASNYYMEYNLGYHQWPFRPWELPSTSQAGGLREVSGYAPLYFSPWNVYSQGSSTWNADIAGPYSATYGHLTYAGHSNLGINPLSLGASFSHYGHQVGRLAVPHPSQSMGARVESDHRTMYELHPFVVDALVAANHPIQPSNLAHYLSFNALGYPEGTLVLDRFSDMRLDADSMSYEELLRLGNRIGSVRTGLSEETIMVLLRRKSYELVISDPLSDAEACSICREEYAAGEEIGVLNCNHEFHTECIKQWLVIKNNCPICKTKGVGA